MDGWMDSCSSHHYLFIWHKLVQCVLGGPSSYRELLPLQAVCHEGHSESCNPVLTGQCYCSCTYYQAGKKSLRKARKTTSWPTRLHTTHLQRPHKHTHTHQACLLLFICHSQPKYQSKSTSQHSIIEGCYCMWSVPLYSDKSSNGCFRFTSCGLVFQNLKWGYCKNK